ncbi:hypothetical protein BURPSPAST_AA1014 [Burkholderia pseudomallei Pasteur 52237]|nr:hypothetical protein BURPSPAST_AA1014 [Burkholderia pseudomallei Pasteur 52237]
MSVDVGGVFERRAPRRSTRERLRASASGPRAGGAELTNDCEERRTS